MKTLDFGDIRSTLFHNITTKQIIFKNVFWLSAGRGISKLLKLILLVYVARIFGVAEYGKFTFAVAFVSLFVIFSNLGLGAIITREFAQRKGKEEEFYSLISLKIVLGLITLVLILITSFFITPDSVVRKVIWILGFFVMVDEFTLFNSYFQACQRMEYQAWGEIINALIATGLGLFIVFRFPSIINLSCVYLFASIVTLVFALAVFHFKFLPLRIRWRKAVWRKFLSMSWPLALAGLFATFYNNIDSVMMGYLGQINETGWYNASYRIIAVVVIPVGLISRSVFPALSKFSRSVNNLISGKIKESRENLQRVWNYHLGIMILLSIPLTVGGIILAPKIITLIYGQNFSSSILAFQIMVVMAGIIFLYSPFLQILIASSQQRKIFSITLFGAAINVILNLILIPKFSLYGAAVATVITHFLMFILFIETTFKYTQIKLLNLNIFYVAVLSLFSAIAMYFAISYPKIYNLPVIFSIIVGTATYFVVFFGLKKISGYFYEFSK
jgi:O-antigen/teichoic acid export membrane protein